MRLLFVCSGNTCRSAMAEGIARRATAELGLQNVTVASAGTEALRGAPASDGALLVALERGDDLTAHRAQPVTAELLAGSDLVLTMGPHHLARVKALGAGERAHLLTAYASPLGEGRAIEDPFGSDLDAYRRTFDELEIVVRRALERAAAERAREQQ